MNLYLVTDKNAVHDFQQYVCFSAVVSAPNEDEAKKITSPHPDIKFSLNNLPYLTWEPGFELEVVLIGQSNGDKPGVINVCYERE